MSVEAHEPTVQHFVRAAQDTEIIADDVLVEEFAASLQGMDQGTIDKCRAAIRDHRGEGLAQKAEQELNKQKDLEES